ncbi:hypothetical protein [Mycolicibacterium fortuitum]|uniref:Uncharacterized protein n=1 Tax=Mycolicibacterium fortuitum TaxID=1766 RepID=A0AAE4VDF9_MYCFO|nr:hypothetical protein [Mycolicibacterium fortuitum]MDV7193345.1 hypothetical protein [Mycolicibacterium fortuitum]MDV7205974.1 hypothetical protein [Mycolicibacterium fortuitum]MDV7227387.1 hypothetical protein [Mycolicibacterium fortuitum]MDV7259916.1 hypothetical protein [Mycolicibacterium fortuitum]MDV7287580.1 hypothetical protein [Mycolicibacterium fortuitum]
MELMVLVIVAAVVLALASELRGADRPLPMPIGVSALATFMWVVVPAVVIGLAHGGIVAWAIAGVGCVVAGHLQVRCLAEHGWFERHNGPPEIDSIRSLPETHAGQKEAR